MLGISVVIGLAAAGSAMAQQSTYPATPLASKHFAYPTGIPYQADTEPQLVRGGQTGYNICNSTTQNQNSLCQTSFVNSVDDFCLWAPIDPNSVVGDIEGEMVAWCTKPGHGTRLIPKDTLQGVQFMRTPDYVQVIGFIDQTKINLKDDDFGGEMDPHGADLRGNPLGGLLYSNAWTGGNDQYTQVIEWHNFIGGHAFCIKACDPSKPNAARYCEHIYDRIGCAYNAPNNAQNGTFESCAGENQDFPGIYVDAAGATQTYRQPPESLGPITSIPYTARVPASSSCVPYTSSVLFAALASVTAPEDATKSAPTPTGSQSQSQTGSGRPTGSRTGTAAGAGSTGNAAETIVVSGAATLLGVVFSAMFFS